MSQVDVVIIGAGLAGLCCARRLQQCGISFRILESSDGVGGRVRTDAVDGFLLDRGFQVYLPAYPEGKRVLDLPALQLRPFHKGAWVWYRGRFHEVCDASEGLVSMAKNLFNPIGSPWDKLRIARLKAHYLNLPLENLDGGENGLALDELRWKGGFSSSMIERFFRPWVGGITLDSSLRTSTRFFRYILRMFAEGGAALPAAGMGAIPRQIASGLPQVSIYLNSTVIAVHNQEVILNNVGRCRSRAVVIATDGTSARRLLGDAIRLPNFHGTITLYHAADESPVKKPILVLNGEGKGLVNHLAVVSEAVATYAPSRKSLISTTIVGSSKLDDQELDRVVRSELAEWFGEAVRKWRSLGLYRIPFALPDQSVEALGVWQQSVRLRPGMYVCGDHRDQASIDGAMTSGFRTAQMVAEDLSSKLI